MREFLRYLTTFEPSRRTREVFELVNQYHEEREDACDELEALERTLIGAKARMNGKPRKINGTS